MTTEIAPTTLMPDAAAAGAHAVHCPVHDWCAETGEHRAHRSAKAVVRHEGAHPVEGPYLEARIVDVDGDGRLQAYLSGGENVDLDAAGLRTEAAKMRVFATEVERLAEQLDDALRPGAEPPPAADRPTTWAINIEGGGQVSGYLPPWAERSSTNDDGDKPIRADRLDLLVDTDHWTSFDGIELRVHGPGFGDPAEPEDVFRGQIQVRPFDSDLASRVPHVDLEVLEGRWMENLGPEELADVIAKLRQQATRLVGIHAQLVAARADWEANALGGGARPGTGDSGAVAA